MHIRSEQFDDQIHKAFDAGDMEAFIRLSEQRDRAEKTSSQKLNEEFAEAIDAGSFETAERLLKEGASVQTRWGHQHGYALHWATWKRHAESLCRLLIAHGADINATDLGGQTALHVAAANGKATAVRVLLASGVDPNIVDGENKTALDWAFGLGKDDVVALLSPVTKHEDIHVAVIAGQAERVRQLLDADPSWATRKTSIVGNTLLHDAVRLGHREIVEFLLSRGADANARSHTTPLKLAHARKLHDIANILKQHGAKR